MLPPQMPPTLNVSSLDGCFTDVRSPIFIPRLDFVLYRFLTGLLALIVTRGVLR